MNADKRRYNAANLRYFSFICGSNSPIFLAADCKLILTGYSQVSPKYLDTLPEQSWNVNKTFRSNSGKIRTVDIYDSFPTYEDATELFEQFGGGKYAILCISPRQMKVGYYEFEGEDRYSDRP